MRSGHGSKRFLAAAAFGGLLATAECPVRLASVLKPDVLPRLMLLRHSSMNYGRLNALQVARIFNAVSCEAFLQLVTSVLVRGTCNNSTDESEAGDPMEVAADEAADAGGDDSRLQLCSDALTDFTEVLNAHSLCDEPDMLRR